ncbi:Calcium-mediated lectin domain-containing protein [Bordetella sputigena]|uniref:hypothetical protein n=1 Tax=Bordetella sputigena TaxID=1416810 RepID=UPI0039EFCC59
MSNPNPGKECDFNVPANRPLYVSVQNEEKWKRTVKVIIDGQAVDIVVPPGGIQGKVIPAGSAASGGTRGVQIQMFDSQNGQMQLSWIPTQKMADCEFVNIGGEKNYPSGGGAYPPESGFNDATIMVYWSTVAPSGAAS